MQLNLGCGTNKIKNCINADCNPDVKPDVVCDLKERLPFDDKTFESIFFFHTIEHIQRRFHELLLSELRRILRPSGKLWISYPEFSVITENWLTNKQGRRDFWEATVYGRQATLSDYHVTAMDTDQFCEILKFSGFKIIATKPEPQESYNTILLCEKAENKPISYEQLLKKEIFS